MSMALVRRATLICALLSVAISPALAEPAQKPSWVNDTSFNAIFDMYWRSRLFSVYAGNRLCSVKPPIPYDDTRSPFRPIDQRLIAAGIRIEQIYPGALNSVAQPYQMPPAQSKCDDQSSAYEALFAFETSVTALERLLDNMASIKPNRKVK